MTSSSSPPSSPIMHVTKRNGSREPVDVTKIVTAVSRCARGLNGVDPLRVATRTISGLYDGATTRELDELSLRTAALLTAEEPDYGLLAARLLDEVVRKEVTGQGIHSFSQSIEAGHAAGLFGDGLLDFVRQNARKLNQATEEHCEKEFDYFGIRTLYDRYLMRHPTQRSVIETIPGFFLRIACGVSANVSDAVALYRAMRSRRYLPSSPTLFNAGTRHPQLSSCFLLDSPADTLEGIYGRYTDVARLSKFAGGIGVAYSRVRSRGALIRSTNGHSNGVVPWLKTLDASVAAVHQGGRRKGACCVYLEPWHPDVEEFLELRDNTGDEARRTHNLNLAHWIPDLFMQRVQTDQPWSLFDPATVPALPDCWGAEFDRAYEEAERSGLAVRQVSARDLYGRMMRTLAQTGNGWMTFKDACNRSCNQGAGGGVVHLSNLCTEIVEVTSEDEPAVCNLGSVNLAEHLTADGPGVDFDALACTVRLAVRQLDAVIDRTFYPLPAAGSGNQRWRPIGLGVMGLQDVFFRLGLSFDDEAAATLSRRLAEEVYFHALAASCDLAAIHGPHPAFAQTHTAAGRLHFDAWNLETADPERWSALRARIREHGLRHSLLVAIAPTATIASIAGCSECIEPQVSNLFKRETLSGDFLVINRHLVAELRRRGLWTPAIRDRIKQAEGSVQGLTELPDDVRRRFRTAWELPQRTLIDLAVGRMPFVDQSQSLNLFLENPTVGALSSMYMYAWQQGLKTTYYLRSRPATRIAQTTVTSATAAAAAVSCSLENPTYCEACQ